MSVGLLVVRLKYGLYVGHLSKWFVCVNSFMFLVVCFNVDVSFFRLTGNGLALGAVADFGAQNCQYTTIVDAWQNIQLTTSSAIEPNACYGLGFFSPSYVRLSFYNYHFVKTVLN